MFHACGIGPGQSETCIWPLKITASALDTKPLPKCRPSGVTLGLQERLGHCGLIRTYLLISPQPLQPQSPLSAEGMWPYTLAWQQGKCLKKGLAFHRCSITMCSCPQNLSFFSPLPSEGMLRGRVLNRSEGSRNHISHVVSLDVLRLQVNQKSLALC